MTAEEPVYRTARPWQAWRDLSDRMSLRTRLITGLLALVIAAVAAISISSTWVVRSYLTSQEDGQLQSVLHGVYVNVVNEEEAHPPVPGVTYPVIGASDNVFAGVQEPGTPLSPSGSQTGLPYGEL